ncbi:hypothetical protein [Allosaccharopolyspora coralli]|nr:hypothetical protein [Allosaccharopolyspora coralli]
MELLVIAALFAVLALLAALPLMVLLSMAERAPQQVRLRDR